MRKPLVRLGIATLVAVVLGASLGYFLRLDLPDVRALEGREPPQMTRVLARDGTEVAAFATEKRIVLDHGEIPRTFREALLASEDSRFFRHTGIDAIGVLRALWSDLRQRRIDQGASTLTMQVAGMLFLDRRDRTVRRKLQEMLLALEIERQYSKEEILRFYCNQVHMGHGLFGLAAASRYYFGKPAEQLTPGESALLVGLLPRPASYSPLHDLEKALERRNLVLRRMVEVGYLDPAEAGSIASEPVVLADRRTAADAAPWFVEEVRRRLRESYGDTRLYAGGLEARTTMDPRLQRDAEIAVERGLRELDRRQGWRPDDVRRVPGDADPREWRAPAWNGPIRPGLVTDGVVIAVGRESATIRVGDRSGTLASEAIEWTGESRPDRLLRVGDVVRVRPLDGAGDGSPALALEQEPLAEAALVALDPASGEVLAVVGGFDYSKSEFNRAVQARRQTGSAFKPFVYATSLARGWTLADTLLDEPTVFVDRRRPEPYQPENFNRGYHGAITLRRALERSANIATVKLAHQVGYEAVIDTARRLGIESRLRPYPSLALGAFEVTLLELTSAYGAFANQGMRVEPHWIRTVLDGDGHALYRAEPRVRDAVSPQVAFLMNHVLSGVILEGTGRAARRLEHTLAGKTGTTDDYTDAWFVGYSPSLVVGVWVGFDEPRSLGPAESGSVAALPIWIDFMERALAGVPDEEFAVPPGLSFVVVDRRTGRRASHASGCRHGLSEVFIEGTEPLESCTEALHGLLELPYPFQRYPLDGDGSLMIPRDQLTRLAREEPDVYVDPLTSFVERHTLDGRVALDLRVLPGSSGPIPDASAVDSERPGWKGTDGRAASVIRFGG